MAIHLQFDRIPPGRVIGPHRHAVETIVYLAAGELVFEHGEGLERRVLVGAGDVLYETPSEHHLVRNEGRTDALALVASVETAEGSRDRGSWIWQRLEAPVRRWTEATVSDEAGIARRLISRAGDLGAPAFAVSEVEVAPGSASDWHRHPGAEHALVVLEGRGTICVEEATETIEPLSGIRIVPGAVHRVIATSRTPLRYIVIGTPGLDPARDRQPAAAPERQRDG
ncbi:MAG TPA: cupin domain-containing protein [Candidatus Limnocylindrales bacterium]|nr:cupin domain-containing protein [Candidatus Limnocylindrales bacterium]